MENPKIVDICFGELPISVSLKSNHILNYSQPHFKSIYLTENTPNSIFVAFKEDLTTIRNGIGYLQKPSKMNSKQINTMMIDQTDSYDLNPFNFMSKSDVQLRNKSIIDLPSFFINSFANFFHGKDHLTPDIVSLLERIFRRFITIDIRKIGFYRRNPFFLPWR